MTGAFLYLVVAVFFVVFSLPTKFISSRKDKAMYLGIAVSLALNLYFFLGLHSAEGMTRFQEWHVFSTFFLPVLLTAPALLLTIIAKGFLRGITPLNKWSVDQAKDLLAHEENIFRRFLAYVLIMVNLPMFFFLGWGIGGCLIVNFVFNRH